VPSWVPGSHEEEGSLILVHGLSVSEVLQIFGVDESSAVPLDPRGVHERWIAAINEVEGPITVGVGRSGDWAFAREHYSARASQATLGRRLSMRGQALICCWLYDARWVFEYWVAGQPAALASTDALVIRAADTRQKLERGFASAGVPDALSLESEFPPGATGTYRPVDEAATYAAFCSALGITLSPEDWDGPLLTGTAWPV
jgi:hypothetical protein